MKITPGVSSCLAGFLVLWVTLPEHRAFVPSSWNPRNSISPPSPDITDSISRSRRDPAVPRRSVVLQMVNPGNSSLEPEEIKQQLQEYLQKRQELNADELAKQ